MKVWLVYIVSAFVLFAKTLPSEFVISSDAVYARAIEPSSLEFLIGTFGNRLRFEVPAKNLSEAFLRMGVKVKFEGESVRFVYRSNLDLSLVQKQIKDFFEGYYKPLGLQVQEVILKPLVQVPQGIQWSKAKLENVFLKKQRFNLVLQDQQQREYLFLCEIEGEIQVYETTKNVRAGEPLSLENTRQRVVAFNSDYAQALGKIEGLEARSYLRANEIILQNKTKAVVILKKGDLIEVVFEEGGIRIVGVFEAMQNASLGEEIAVRHPKSKKQIKVKLISSKRAKAL